VTWPHRDPDLEAEALAATQRKGDGRGCGGCGYLGFGPGLAARCLHPARACWVSVTTWALGCPQRRGITDKEDPEGPVRTACRVALGPHNDLCSRAWSHTRGRPEAFEAEVIRLRREPPKEECPPKRPWRRTR
jgi:hypothetical protein